MHLSNTTTGILALWLLPGLGPKRIHKLWDHFGSLEKIFTATPGYLSDLLGVARKTTQLIPGALGSKELRDELNLIKTFGIKPIDFTQPDYPARLREIYNAPPILYTKGNLDLNRGFYLAFVGSRKASFSGKQACKKLIERLVELRADTVVVSGLALGIDTMAHKAALEAGAKTVAVLANGLTSIYPSRNQSLAEEIQNQGSILTEFPMASRPVPINFPLRNRIISGLASGVVVVEAGEKSGATITAGYALEQNRELFALPGPSDSGFYRGTNRLIQAGHAKLVIDAEDILEEFYTIRNEQLSFSCLDRAEKTPVELSNDERSILELIRSNGGQKDKLLKDSMLPIQKFLATLTALEMKGHIVSKPGSTYELVNRNT